MKIQKAIEEYLITNKTIQDVAKDFDIDRKLLSKEIKRQYPSYLSLNYINICNVIHNNKYDYSLVSFKNLRDKINIICPIHGNFEQEAFSHKKGIGCSKCSYEYFADKRLETTEVFIFKSKNVHGEFYDYSKTQYVNNKTKVIITCLHHGDFLQAPDDHKQGKGCLKCARENIGWTKTKWKNLGKERIAKVYILKCWNESEQFVKIGRTFNSILRRYGSKGDLPYDWEIIKVFESENYEDMWNKEVLFHRLYKNNKYQPMLKFAGETECYNISIMKDFIDEI